MDVQHADATIGHPVDQPRSNTAGQVGGAGPIVLVVDDDPSVVDLISMVLGGEGFVVLGATDAASAVSQVRVTPPDMAILDVRMEGTDGIELLGQLRSVLGDDMAPVIFLSPLRDVESRQRGFDAGGIDCLPKPFLRGELVARVRAHLGRERERRRLAAEVETATEVVVAATVSLEAKQAELETLFDAIPQAVFVKDAAGVYLSCNLATARFLGRPREEVLGHTDRDLFGERVASELREADAQALGAADPVVREERLRSADGTPVTFLTTRVPVHRPDGELIGVLGVAHDQSERLVHDELLRAERNRLNDALDAAAAATWELDPADHHLIAGTRLLELLGEPPAIATRISSDGWMRRLHEDDRAMVRAAWDELRSGATDRHDLEYRVRHRDGRYVWVRDLSRASGPSSDSGARTIRGLLRDITQERQHRQEVEFASQHDGLTGLSNRQRFADLLRAELVACKERGDQLAVMVLDLDGFAAINQLHGRAAGNQVLGEIAVRLIGHVQDRSRVARIGGDEFAVIVPIDGPAAALQTCAEELLELVGRPVIQRDVTMHTTASIGVTLAPQLRAADPEQLLRQADQAVYQAKLTGKARFHVFDPVDDAYTRERYLLYADIERGLKAGEFVLHYQPQVNMRTGALVGVEALVRWEHPELGFLPPVRFVPAIAGQPLAITLGNWVIEHAIAQAAEWNDQGLRTTISVNVDTAQLFDESFASRLEAQLAAHPGVEPEQLRVEIVESGALDDLGHVSDLLQRLRQLGVLAALDDFGTGFSSLTLLKQLPAEVIKIDRSFVMEMLDDPEHVVIIESVVKLCHSFQRTVLAEGVETEEHGRILLELGCDQAQGFGIARPMSAEDLGTWLATWSPPEAWRRVTPIADDRLPVLVVELEHARWMRSFDRFLAGHADAPPVLEPNRCRLGRWLARQPTIGAPPDLESLRRSHLALHDVALRLVDAGAVGTSDQIEDLRTTIRAISEELGASLLRWRQDGT